MNPARTEDDNTSGGIPPLEVSCGILLQEGKILCAKRLPQSGDSRWEFPGGKREPGESSEQALSRELREELDVEVDIVCSLTPVLFHTPHFFLRLSPFLCRISKNIPRLTVHEELRWVRREELDQLDWLEANRVILAELETIPLHFFV